MNKNTTKVPKEFPDITKLNDKRLLGIFKKYRKLINVGARKFDGVILATIRDRHSEILEELTKRPHIERS